MDFPVFGQNPAMVAAAQAAQIAPSAGGSPAASAQTTETASAQAATASTLPVASSANPMGFLDMVRATQHQYASADSSGTKRGLVDSAFGDDGFGFDDVLDAINPLQHLPIISTIYRAITGDQIDVAPRLIGGAIYGGFFGFLSAAVDAAVEGSTGHDIGDNVRIALFGEPDNAPREPVIFADNQPASGQTADTPAASPATGPGPWYAAGQAAANVVANPQPPLAATAATSETGGTKAPGLTPAQISLLQEYATDDGFGAIAPAAGSPADSTPPKTGEAVDLTPAQADLLMRSVGLKPPAKSDVLWQAKPGNESADLPAMDASIGAANAGDAGGAAEDIAASKVPSATPLPKPVPANSARVAPVGVKDQTNFARRMQFGLDRYMAHRTPINTKPPHLDVIQ